MDNASVLTRGMQS